MEKKSFKKGFGLIEVLISATIIAIMLGALVSVGHMGLSSTQNLLSRSQATFLSQEGLEIVRQIRDSNWMDGNNQTDWNSFQWDNIISGKLTAVADRTTYELKWQNGRWGAIHGTENIVLNNTTFQRSITFETVGTDLLPNEQVTNSDGSIKYQSVYPDKNAKKVTVEVAWYESGNRKSVSSSELITNWQPKY